MTTRNLLRDREQATHDDAGTVGSSLAPSPEISATQTAAAVLTEDVGFGRNKVRVLNEQYGDLHQESVFIEWQTRTAGRGKAAPADQLAALADLGFAWRDVARLLGVSVAAVKKWRRNESVSGESRRKIAALLAACDLIADHYEVGAIASWFEMPLLDGIPVTPLDLYAGGQHKLVFEYGGGHADPEQVLSEFDPDWREHYRSNFEVFRAADGALSIGSKDR